MQLLIAYLWLAMTFMFVEAVGPSITLGALDWKDWPPPWHNDGIDDSEGDDGDSSLPSSDLQRAMSASKSGPEDERFLSHCVRCTARKGHRLPVRVIFHLSFPSSAIPSCEQRRVSSRHFHLP